MNVVIVLVSLETSVGQMTIFLSRDIRNLSQIFVESFLFLGVSSALFASHICIQLCSELRRFLVYYYLLFHRPVLICWLLP